MFVPGSQVIFGSRYLYVPVPAGVQATPIHELGLDLSTCMPSKAPTLLIQLRRSENWLDHAGAYFAIFKACSTRNPKSQPLYISELIAPVSAGLRR